jgi:RimJ/RimL family protein N-acetyltransferase
MVSIQGGVIRMAFIGKDTRIRLTERLRLEPITHAHAQDYFLVFQDDGIAEWYAGKLTHREAQQAVNEAEHLWQTLGFHKWLVYDRETGSVVGRAGVSAMRLHAYNGAIRAFLPAQAWVDEVHGTSEATQFARRWGEIGWALRSTYWGRGYATEIGRYGLRVAFEELDMYAVVSFTERHNLRSRAVMERIGMTAAGEFHGPGLIAGQTGIDNMAPFALYIASRHTWSPKQ